MLEFYSMPDDDKQRALNTAREWRKVHRDHVKELLSAHARSPQRITYPPSGSDIFRPELWKPAMWRWLAQQDART